jgi:hypothetical protein
MGETLLLQYVGPNANQVMNTDPTSPFTLGDRCRIPNTLATWPGSFASLWRHLKHGRW